MLGREQELQDGCFKDGTVVKRYGILGVVVGLSVVVVVVVVVVISFFTSFPGRCGKVAPGKSNPEIEIKV